MCPDDRQAKTSTRSPQSGHGRRLERLFPPLSPQTATALDGYAALLRRVLALKPAMERELPRRIRELSLSLTAEREGGPRPGYLSDPRTLTAYAWYFLPWNLYRLSRLLPALDLDLPENGLVCDLGCGPLTLVQALWLSRPDLRQRRLRFVCLDRSRRALDVGLELFAGLAGFDPQAEDAPWRIRAVRGEYWQGLTDGADLVAMVNVANELAGGSGREPLEARMERLAVQLGESLAAGGRALVVEPGTRLGWRCLLGLREAFVEMEYSLAAPCPHHQDCPLRGGRTRAWCHFTMAPQGAPAWLGAVSDRAGLGKERLSLSFLLARKAQQPGPAEAVRVVSGAFGLSDAPGSAVYGCSAKGLVVLVSPDGRPPRSGDLLTVEAGGAAVERDAKSGAPRLTLPPSGEPSPRSGSDPTGPPRKPARPRVPHGQGKAPRTGGHDGTSPSRRPSASAPGRKPGRSRPPAGSGRPKATGGGGRRSSEKG